MNGYPRVHNVVFASRVDRSDEINAAADRHRCPPRLIVAQGIAESNLNETAERWGTWPDCSFGAWQQTVRYAPIGDRSASAANIAVVRARFTQDVAYALDVAARQLGAYWQQHQNGPETMSRYNGGPGMQLAHNPNARHIVDSWERSARYVATEEPSMPDDYAPHVLHDRGTIAGTFNQTPAGIILHGSRSGVAGRPIAQEFDGTRRYAASGIELGWNVTVGDDAISLHMDAEMWGWNARGASRRYLAVEFAQPTARETITDGQVRAFCWWVRTHVLPRWPFLNTASLPMHSELPEGRQDGKSDCYPSHDPRADDLRARIAATLAGGTEEDPMRIAELEARVRELESYVGAVGHDVIRPTVQEMEDYLAAEQTGQDHARVQGWIDRLQPHVVA